jgi:hypothetical protein
MSSKEYYEGKLMEENKILHAHLAKILNFDKVEVRGETTTKGDVVGVRGEIATPVSVKNGSQKNTQVHLPTLRSFVKAMSIPNDIAIMLEQWLGTTSHSQFNNWLNGKTPTRSQQKYKRLFATDIYNWNNVVKWFNDNKPALSKLLIQSLNDEKPAEYLVWVDKNKNRFQVINIEILANWINTECNWVTGPRNNGSTLRCEDKNGKPIFHLQMKGSGGTNGEYNHNPQFHIHTHWPQNAVVYEGAL